MSYASPSRSESDGELCLSWAEISRAAYIMMDDPARMYIAQGIENIEFSSHKA